jgi:hypothetical protein
VTKQALLLILEVCGEDPDGPERGRELADDALLAFINDPEITEAFRKLTRGYS